MLSIRRGHLGRSRRRRGLLLTLGAVACATGAMAVPAYGAGSGSVSATVPVIPLIVKSVTVSPSSFNFIVCGYPVGNRLTGGYVQYTGDQMTLPNGECGALADSGGPVGVTAPGLDTLNITNNGTTPEFISVQATDAVPADNGTPWKLTTQPPGLDQFAIWNGFQDNYLASTPTYLTHAPAPDKAVQLGVGNQGILAPGTTAHEQMGIEGPSASSDLSTQFSTTITWIAG